MPIFDKAELRASAQEIIKFSAKTADEILQKSQASSKGPPYDIFLSHRFIDGIYILGLKAQFEKIGYSVFVDWVEKPMDRAKVVSTTANWLRQRMKECRCLFYAISENSSDSKWMPWELGYSDGIHGKVGIVPIAELPTKTDNYIGQEYLGLYPYVIKELSATTKKDQIWIHEHSKVYIDMPSWLQGKKPIQH